MNILIFGGSFNPPHIGHTEMCKYIAENIKADKILIVPAFLPVHKDVDSSFASTYDRFNMCALAFPDYEICDWEIKQNKACYTVETLSHFKKLYPNDNLFFACGSDMFLSLDTWRDTEKLFTLATFCAVPRKNEFLKMLEKGNELEKQGLTYKLFEKDIIEISSTEIRKDILNHKSSDYLSAEVNNYISENRLYGA